MTRRIAIATCPEYAALSDDDRPIVLGLAAAGVDAEPAVWNAEVDWSRYDAVLLRSVWDYHLHALAFSAWLDLLDQRRIPCWNPTSLVRWNLDKHYLSDLAARGIPTVPTLWLEHEDRLTPEAAAARVLDTGWPDLVVKPAVSAGAWRTLRLGRDQVAGETGTFREMLAAGSVMAQPFMSEILAEGEWSLLFFGGAFSHAVIKRPRDGDFRVQWTHGGRQVPVTPPASVVAQAQEVLAAAPSAGLYARVDGVLREGRLILMELEQIEPYLYLADVPGSVDRFVQALRERL